MSDVYITAIDNSLEHELANNDMESILDRYEFYNKYKFYYISDIHLEHRFHNNKIKTRKSKYKYIDSLVKRMGKSDLDTDFLILNGDISSTPCYTLYFLSKVKNVYRNVVYVLGNHELWNTNYKNLNEIIEMYSNFCQSEHIIFLHNSLLLMVDYMYYIFSESELNNMSIETLYVYVKRSPFIILGGLGFSGFEYKYNASSGLYKKIIIEQKDKKESEKFLKLYDKIKELSNLTYVIVVTHTPMENWGGSYYSGKFKSYYLSGHTHHNSLKTTNKCEDIRDNQKGYHTADISLKYFMFHHKHPFDDYLDGIYEISKDDYKEFYEYNRIDMHMEKEGIIYMLKSHNYYCFLYKTDKNNNLYLLNGGAIKKLNIVDIEYYYNNLGFYGDSIKKLLYEYMDILYDISEYVKSFGGMGYIHGNIVDISFKSHIYVNYLDKSLIFYYAENMVEKYVYSNLSSLLYDKDIILYNNYIDMYSNKKENGLLNIEDSFIISNVIHKVTETDIYKMSNIFKSLQYIINNGIIRKWSDKLAASKNVLLDDYKDLIK